jgi:hypothetical protein
MQPNLEEIAKSLPPEAQPVLRENGFFEADRLNAGDASPRIPLIAREDGRIIEVGGAETARPTVLIFGSYT